MLEIRHVSKLKLTCFSAGSVTESHRLFNALRICEAATEVEVFSKAYSDMVSEIAKVDK